MLLLLLLFWHVACSVGPQCCRVTAWLANAVAEINVIAQQVNQSAICASLRELPALFAVIINVVVVLVFMIAGCLLKRFARCYGWRLRIMCVQMYSLRGEQ